MWHCRKGLWKNNRLSHLRGLWHFTTTRKLGDARKPPSRERALSVANAAPARLIMPRQVHGRRVLALKGNSHPASPRADGLVTSKPGVALGIVSADCLPIFLVDKEHRAAALVHAGWRGLVKGILRRAVRVMKKSFGTRPSQCLAAIGPHIHSCCYEVGLVVARLFHVSDIKSSGAGRYRLNLGKAAARQLRGLGIPIRFSDVCPACTGCRPKDFFSYRREQTDKRHLSAIGFYGN